MKLTPDQRRLIDRLAAVLEAYRGRYAELGGTRRFDAYLAGTARREDEELLTEPVLADLLEQVLKRTMGPGSAPGVDVRHFATGRTGG